MATLLSQVAHSAQAASRRLSGVPFARLLAHLLAICQTVLLDALNLFRNIACPGIIAFSLGGYEGLRHPLEIPTPTPGLKQRAEAPRCAFQPQRLYRGL